jgi:hypothetical protein
MGEVWFEPVLYVHAPLPPLSLQSFYLPLFNSIAKKKIPIGIKNIGGRFVPLPPPKVTPSVQCQN